MGSWRPALRVAAFLSETGSYWIVLNRIKVWLAFCFERITLAAVMRKE